MYFPVDVTDGPERFLNDSSTSTQLPNIGIPTQPRSSSLNTRIRASHPSYQRIIGSIRPYTREIKLENQKDSFICVSDGSVCSNNASAAYVIHSLQGNKTRLHSSLPVDGCSRKKNSYRAELMGILAVLITLNIILSQTQETDQMSGTIWCDSESVLKRVNRLHSEHPYSIKHGNEDEYDLIHEIFVQKQKLKVPTAFKWVKGHQHKPTTHEGRLNIVADNLATDHYSFSNDQQATEKPLIMPNQMLHVTLGGTTYTNDISREISRHFHGYDSEEYICKKLNIDDETLGLIDWETIKSSNTSLNLQE